VRILVVGLGNMGGGMAANLVAAGHDVTGRELDPAKCAMAAERGVHIVDDLAAAADAEVVMTSVPGPAQVAGVGTGILPVMQPDTVWIDLSTNDLDCARRMAALAAPAGVHLVDAPVSGGPEGAAAGSLSVYVGGDAGPVTRCGPIFDAIGSRVNHLGPHGAGYSAKIAQVTLCYTQTVTLIEAMLLGVKGGVAPARMLDIIRHSAGRSYSADVYGPEILAGTYDTSFPLGHAAKDLRLAMEMAATVGADLPHMARVADLYAAALEIHGPSAPHLLAAHLLERDNDLILHEEAP